jgi:hypothetical protein
MSTNIPPQPAQPPPPPPPPAGGNAIYSDMTKLSDDSSVIKSAHFIAAERKGNSQTIFGVCIIVLNVLIGSTLIEAVIPEKAGLVIRLLAFLAASLAGIQTFFNFQKVVDCHTKSGDVYSSINRRLGLLMAEYKDETRSRADIIADYKVIRDEYLTANDDGRPCVPTDGDLRKAREGLGKKKAAELSGK